MFAECSLNVPRLCVPFYSSATNRHCELDRFRGHVQVHEHGRDALAALRDIVVELVVEVVVVRLAQTQNVRPIYLLINKDER
jgi:hypothetical protein